MSLSFPTILDLSSSNSLYLQADLYFFTKILQVLVEMVLQGEAHFGIFRGIRPTRVILKLDLYLALFHRYRYFLLKIIKIIKGCLVILMILILMILMILMTFSLNDCFLHLIFNLVARYKVSPQPPQMLSLALMKELSISPSIFQIEVFSFKLE